MTDDKIRKALECCAGGELSECIGNECPFFEPWEDCVQAMATEVLDLINRQKAEIDRLESLVKEFIKSNGEINENNS